MGRPAKPTALHKLHGTYNATKHGRDRAAEPVPEGDLSPAAPDWFGPGQKASWDYAMRHAPRGLLKQIDRAMLALWCEAEDRWRIAVAQQAKLDSGSPMPLLTKGAHGPVASPYLRIIRHAAEQMMVSARELGFSPAARPRLAAGGAADPARKESPWAFLASAPGEAEGATRN